MTVRPPTDARRNKRSSSSVLPANMQPVITWSEPGPRIKVQDSEMRRPLPDTERIQGGNVTMLIATTPFIAGWRVTETRGQVFGLVVRSRGLGGNIMAGLRSLGGGEIHEYTSLLEDTRRQAIDRMVQNATMMGANAVLSMRFDSSGLANTMSEIVAYGTAVVVVQDANAPQPGE
jgi:uncharacterized protein YbjQ (UPF0145 family)